MLLVGRVVRHGGTLLMSNFGEGYSPARLVSSVKGSLTIHKSPPSWSSDSGVDVHRAESAQHQSYRSQAILCWWRARQPAIWQVVGSAECGLGAYPSMQTWGSRRNA